MSSLLYKRQPAWGLPSLSPACIQAEALLRFAGGDFRLVIQNEPGRSPTGSLPAYEKERRLASTEICNTEFDATRGIHGSLTPTSADVDGHLARPDLLMARSLSTFIQRDLEPATLYSLWCEPEGFKQYKEAYSANLVPPLDFVVAKTEQRRIRQFLQGETSEKIYEKACRVLESISEFLEGKNGYLFGDAPCSTDAFLYGHLLFYRLAPVIAPILQRKMNQLENLKTYVERISKNYFQEVAPILETADLDHDEEEEEMTSTWATQPPVQWFPFAFLMIEFKGWGTWDTKKLWEDWKKIDRGSRWWLGGAVALLFVYSWFRPPFVYVVEQDGPLFADEEETE